MPISLTPSARLVWHTAQSKREQAPALIQDAFASHWCEGLFALAAHKDLHLSASTLRYWRTFAEAYLTALCHQFEGADWVVEPEAGEFTRLCTSAPPMVGGEYLTEDMLLRLWEALDSWVYDTADQAGGLPAFMEAWAPQWNRVGKVCFHLAENKKNPSKPFAFLATYSTGLAASGQLKYQPMGQALKEYGGRKDKARLINLLTPVVKASEACEWVQELLSSGKLYKPLAWSPESAYEFLLDIPLLEESGLMVRVPDWWKKRTSARVSVVVGEERRARFGADAMLDFDVSVALGDAHLSEAEIKELLAQEDGFLFFKGQWIELDRAKLSEVLAHWRALREDTSGVLSFAEGMRLLAGASVDLMDDVWEEEEQAWLHVQAGAALRDLLAHLRSPAQIEKLQKIKGLNATLRPYQERGVAWLAFLTRLGLGACLADDMGLGKTIQVLSLLLHFKEHAETHAPSLLVVPASLLGNWKHEAATFAPSLRLLILHPSETPKATLDEIAEGPEAALAEVDLVVTSFAILIRQAWLATYPWHLVALDEAQAIKNPSTKQTRAAKKLQASARIALTGTPIENRLGDLWSLFDFLNPGLLGSSKVFKRFTKQLQQREREPFAPLRRLVSPYIMRRMKTDPTIIDDLPEKTEMVRFCHLSKGQAKLYQGVVDTLREALRSDEAPEGIQRSGLVLQSLMRLKQICNHPSQVIGDGAYQPKDSGKFLQLKELCEEIASRQEKVLLFTQFREIMDALEAFLADIFGQSGLLLHGGTPVKKRKSLVDTFQAEDGPPFFLLSLKAGGTGLNLTAANHVIHFDRWWNPAVENQATDRAFRIGQKRNVLVHKFVTQGTIEERIDALIQEKQELAEDVLAGEDALKVTELSESALFDLIRLDVTRASF